MPTMIAFPVLTLAELGPAVQKKLGHPEQFHNDGPPPAEPGCYVWTTNPDGGEDPADHAVVYIGSAASLARRLSNYDGWIQGHEPDLYWSVTVIHMLHDLDATVRWITVNSHDTAKQLERLLIEWHRTRVGAAPPIVGWDAKKGSPRAAAQDEARALFQELQPLQAAET